MHALQSFLLLPSGERINTATITRSEPGADTIRLWFVGGDYREYGGKDRDAILAWMDELPRTVTKVRGREFI